MNEDDIKFLQEMLEHHESALVMAKKYLEGTSPKTRKARVGDLARDIIKAQTSEIAQMKGWLKEAGAKAKSSGGGH